MRHAGMTATQIEKSKRLAKHARTTLDAARSAITRAKVVTITAQHLLQTTEATRYENRLIRGKKR